MQNKILIKALPPNETKIVQAFENVVISTWQEIVKIISWNDL